MRIEIDDVHKSYGSITALDGVSLEISSGTTFGLLGTNGAGKTTLFELLVGHDTPDSGRLAVGGIDVATAGPGVREHIGFLPEQVGFPLRLTGREVLRVHGRIRDLGTDREPRIDEVLSTVGLSTAADRPVSGYSNGMQTRLGLAAALLSSPTVLVLDEPTAGLDPIGVEAFHQLIERISEERDATVLLSSHALGEVERLCDEVAILHDGQLRTVQSVPTLGHEDGTNAEVVITTDSDTNQAQVVESVQRYGSVTVQSDRIAVSVPPGQVVEVISGLETEWVRGIEVRAPGLASVFHDAIETATGDTPQEVLNP